WTGIAERPAVGVQALQEADGLEKVVGVWFRVQMVFDRRWQTRTRGRRGGSRARRRVAQQGLVPQGSGLSVGFRSGYRSWRSAARGGHFLKYPSPCLVLPTNWLNEFMVAYRPRKRSRTQANRNTPM